MFFNLRIVSKSPAEVYTPIGAVLELFAGSVQLFGVGEQVHAGLTSPPSVPRGR